MVESQAVSDVTRETLEAALQLDSELEVLGNDLWAMEQRAMLMAKVVMVDDVVRSLKNFVSLTSTRVTQFKQRQAQSSAAASASVAVDLGQEVSVTSPATPAPSPYSRCGRSHSRARNKMRTGRWSIDSDTEEEVAGGVTRATPSTVVAAGTAASADVAETPCVLDRH